MIRSPHHVNNHNFISGCRVSGVGCRVHPVCREKVSCGMARHDARCARLFVFWSGLPETQDIDCVICGTTAVRTKFRNEHALVFILYSLPQLLFRRHNRAALDDRYRWLVDLLFSSFLFNSGLFVFLLPLDVSIAFAFAYCQNQHQHQTATSFPDGRRRTLVKMKMSLPGDKVASDIKYPHFGLLFCNCD